jgi:hypothetical protein
MIMARKTIKLSVGELCQLNQELSSEKGLLLERLPIVLKYHLTKVAKLAAVEQDAVNSQREELIKNLGEAADDGSFSIPQFISTPGTKKGAANKVVNPGYTKFVEDMEALLGTISDVEYEEISLDDMKNLESSGNYPILFKMIDA